MMPLCCNIVLMRSATGVEGDVGGGVVGYAIDAFDAFDPQTLVCSRCVEGTSAAIAADGSLESDAVLGVSNPFVDAGDDVGVSTDLRGVAIPQGAAPDLGALERDDDTT